MTTFRMFTADEAGFVEALGRVNAANPFLPERIAAERAALGAAFVEAAADWNKLPPTHHANRNATAISERCEVMIARLRAQWPAHGQPLVADWEAYEELVGFWLYHRYAARFDHVIRAALAGASSEGRVDFFPAFKRDAEEALDLPRAPTLASTGAAHWFACAYQIRRAFHAIFHSLVGGSAPMVRLRAEIWQSIFSHDLRRYRRSLFARMGDFSTLITGPSGTGKELVARALAFSRYLAYQPKGSGFGRDFTLGFFPLNLAALSPTLIESELFGHRRGAFTGALSDRAGWMEVCPPTGAVFLDEIGEVDVSIQVKLLRVLQSRTFQPLGSTESRHFEGKVVAATNRDLPAEIRAGRFREDLYYRLCSDWLTTPSLREQLDASPGDLPTLVGHIAERFLGLDEAPGFLRTALEWIRRNLGDAYPWPGNFRELEQCVRSLVLRGEYRPAAPLVRAPSDDWNRLIGEGALTAEDLLRRYVRIVHAQAGTIEATARRLNLDRRTVRARLSAS